MKKLAADRVSILIMVRRELDAIMRNSGTAHPFVEEPIHRAAAFECHAGSHDGFHFVLEVLGGERTVSELGHQFLEERNEARVDLLATGLPCHSRLAEHFPEHMNNPRTLAVNEVLIRGRGFGGIKA